MGEPERVVLWVPLGEGLGRGEREEERVAATERDSRAVAVAQLEAEEVGEAREEAETPGEDEEEGEAETLLLPAPVALPEGDTAVVRVTRGLLEALKLATTVRVPE